MKKIIVSLALVLLASTAMAGTKTTRIYDNNGNEIGYVRETGVNYQMYDGKGRYQGRITKNNDGSKTAWSRDGAYQGHSTCVGECDPQEREEE